MLDGIVTHFEPVWRDRADFLIRAGIHEGTADSKWKWEQLWTRQVSFGCFELCCIPFFIYDLSLGDHVATDSEYVLTDVLAPSGRFVFRIWFNDHESRLQLPPLLEDMGCLLERRFKTSRLLAIDTETEQLAHAVADLLDKHERLGTLVFETGRISRPD